MIVSPRTNIYAYQCDLNSYEKEGLQTSINLLIQLIDETRKREVNGETFVHDLEKFVDEVQDTITMLVELRDGELTI